MNSRIGFRWSTDLRLITADTVRRLLPRLKEAGVGWLVFPIPVQSFPEAQTIAEATCAAGLTPLVHLLPRGGHLTPDTVRESATRWVAGGVKHVVVDDEPNRAERWSRWVAQGLPQRYARWIAPLIDSLAAFEDVTPIFPPLAPRGDYRGQTFLGEALRELRRFQPAWIKRLAVSCVNDQNGQPVAWGKGGKALWGDVYRQGMEDDNGFFGWEWTQQTAGDALQRMVDVFALQSLLNAGDPPDSQVATVHTLRELARTASVPLVTTFPALGSAGWFNENGTVAAPHLLEALRTEPPEEVPDKQSVPRTLRVLHANGRVETMDLDEYLRGVIPAEIGAGSPPEALKAQAVAARCYAARTVRSPRHRNANADICTTTHCQVWRPKHYPRTDEAVSKTMGIVAYSEGRIIDAVYFACCNGNTKNSEDVWRSALPYLRSVPCTLKHQPQYGHGVGMCQRGAIQMARQGASFGDILRHYYTGVTVERGVPSDGIPAPAPVPPPPQAPPPPAAIRIERRSGARAVAGNLRHDGVMVTVADPWGNQYRTQSGSKPELGSNGWEIRVPVDAVYRVTWADKSVNVPVRGDFVVILEG